MASVSKSCSRCGSVFTKPSRISKTQWDKRMFCSKRCSATKKNIPILELKELYESKLSGEDIAKKFGISATHVRRLLRKAVVTIRSNGEPQRIAMSKPEIKEKMSKASTGRRHSIETRKKMSSIFGDQHPLWKGGVTRLSNGYLAYTNSPQNNENRNKYVHQVIARQKYGRWANDSEHIHHLDGNKLNNHPDNLLLMSASAHAKLHHFKKES